MYCYYKCSVALPHIAVGWSAKCDCGIYDHAHLQFGMCVQQILKSICTNAHSAQSFSLQPEETLGPLLSIEHQSPTTANPPNLIRVCSAQNGLQKL